MPPKRRPRLLKIPKLSASARNMIETIELVIPCGMWGQIREYLFTDTSKEYACYLLCGHSRRTRTLRLLGCYLVLPEPDDYVSHSLARVELKRSLLATVLSECERLGLSLVDLHSHPFTFDHVSFSSVDEADEREKADWFSKHLPGSYFGSVVLGQACHQARIRSAVGNVIDLPLRIRTVDTPLERRPEGQIDVTRPEASLDRHVRAFGAAGHSDLVKHISGL